MGEGDVGTLIVGWEALAKYMKCSKSTAQRRVYKEGLPIWRLEFGKKPIWFRPDVDAWMREHSEKKIYPCRPRKKKRR